MAKVVGIWTSPARKSGTSVGHELRPGLRAELDGKRGMLTWVVDSGEIAVGDEIELL